ncbi:MAG: exodeoxyribonuclease VII large subunit [Ignavibacteriaceae bacterium]
MAVNIDVLTVSELTKQIKISLEENFSQISVEGEISNFKAHNSGHWYFNLKDSAAVISCTMWKSFNNYVFFTPEDGMKIIVNGKITVYPPRGSYQIDVRSIKPSGVGELQAAFERLKQRLALEGLFDEEFKKTIPVFPKKIGIVTAIDGAAFRDMISVAERRFPLIELIIAPAKVQGNGAAASIVDSIKQLNKTDVDVIIVGRGGGSIEDLWAFNEEIVAREIFNSKIPIITGIGHEVDFTISDFVADLRAPTPSAAMEIATPNKEDYFAFINDFSYNSTEIIIDNISKFRKEIKNIIDSYGFRMPIDFVRRRMQQIDNLQYKLHEKIERKFLLNKSKISLLSKILESQSMEKTLKRGFILVKQNSNYITRAKDFNKEESSKLIFYDNEIELNKN